MKRRAFLKGAGTVGVAGAAAFSAPAIGAEKRELKMVTAWPRNFPGFSTSAERFARRITAMTNGSLTVKVLPAGDLVSRYESFDAVSSGIADIYHAVESFWQGKSKAFNFFAAMPFGLTASEMSAWIYHGGGQEVWDRLSAEYNLKPFLAGNTGGQMGGWFNREISTVDDFDGLKIRMPGLGGEVLRRIGAEAKALPGGEIVAALHSGVIDAVEWFGPWLDLELGVHKAAKFYYYPGFHQPGTAISTAINRKVWESLPTDQKAAIEAAAAAETAVTLAEFNARNGEALDILRTKHKVRIRKFSSTILRAVGEAAGQVVSDIGASEPATRQVYDSFTAFRRRTVSWSKVADQSYMNARLLPFKYD
jgi:TRAP-type mannitol/chloroaromatic compound transport system substrate-binding protein